MGSHVAWNWAAHLSHFLDTRHQFAVYWCCQWHGVDWSFMSCPSWHCVWHQTTENPSLISHYRSRCLHRSSCSCRSHLCSVSSATWFCSDTAWRFVIVSCQSNRWLWIVFSLRSRSFHVPPFILTPKTPLWLGRNSLGNWFCANQVWPNLYIDFQHLEGVKLGLTRFGSGYVKMLPKGQWWSGWISNFSPAYLNIV